MRLFHCYDIELLANDIFYHNLDDVKINMTHVTDNAEGVI